MADTIDQQFVQFIVQSIVGNPDAVKVERTIDEKGVLLELTVAPDDLGRVIGKRGNTAQSIRTLLRALGTKNDARYNLKIVDVGGPSPRPAASDDNQDNAQADANEPADETTSGADAWAHLKSDDDQGQADAAEEGTETADESSTDGGEEDSSVVEKTRKELDELAGIDI